MAESILHNSPPKEPKKTDPKPDPETYLNGSRYLPPEAIEPINALERLSPLIKAASVCYLPGPADHFVGILEETITNLTRLHEALREIDEILVKGGDR
jgi:hypothetical protein